MNRLKMLTNGVNCPMINESFLCTRDFMLLLYVFGVFSVIMSYKLTMLACKIRRYPENNEKRQLQREEIKITQNVEYLVKIQCNNSAYCHRLFVRASVFA